jgi:predicted RNA-binding Zn ribbon-like protein
LEEVRHLLNSDDRFRGVDHTRDVATFNAFLDLAGSTYAHLPASADLAPYRAFRDVTRELLLRPVLAARETFTAIARRYPMTVDMRADGVHLRRAGRSRPSAVDRMIGDAIAVIHEAMLTGDWERLAECERDDCQWIYYDPAPNRGTRWCSTDPCGNVMKVRAYRARRRAG